MMSLNNDMLLLLLNEGAGKSDEVVPDDAEILKQEEKQ